uniref:Uncharacterized protein n=1 Tax=Gopherus agassizii TaxID=38772 RepID=A0A452GIY8_9SAUR
VALLIDATLPKTGSGLTLWLLESGCLKLLGTHRAFVFFVGMGLMNVGKTMNTLQICLLGKLWVACHYVLLQIFCLTECLFTHMHSRVALKRKTQLMRISSIQEPMPYIIVFFVKCLPLHPRKTGICITLYKNNHTQDNLSSKNVLHFS